MPSTKRVTLRDVAADTGLSTAAVSYALRGLHVPEATQQRVREAAERLGYQADPIGRALASGRTGTVGVLSRSLEDIWQQDLVAALGRAFLAVDLPALILDAGDDPGQEAELVAQLRDQRVEALVATPVDPAGAYWAAVARQLPLVSVGDAIPGAGCAAEVLFDNGRAVRLALSRLVEAGHTRIAVLVTAELSTPDRPIEQVAHAVAEELGVQVTLHPTPYDMGAAADHVATLLAGSSPPTGFFAISDTMAYGVYAAARRLELAIPDDLAVIGFDGNQFSTVLTPPLSGFRWPLEELVTAVVDRTLAAIEGHASEQQLPGWRTVFSPAVVEGGSVTPL